VQSEEGIVQAVSAIIDAVVTRRAGYPPAMALLIGLSGIDGSGKGDLASHVVAALSARQQKVALINVVGWLNLPAVRYDAGRPAENFYENALRLDELFAQLVLPLRSERRVRLTMDWGDETATAPRRYTYEFDDLDLIVVEGIYLFKRAYRGHFDLAVWVDCSWETALERAIARSQEGLSPNETVQAYHTIYFPAQRVHFKRDDPRGSADLVVPNDPRLRERQAAGS
jgi:uridine kinase